MLDPKEYNPYYQVYLDKVQNVELISGLELNGKKTAEFLNAIPEELWTYAYAEGKWTIKEVIQHIIDTERIFSYRALRFARKDHSELPGFDQDDYVISGNANDQTKGHLLKQYKLQRQATISLFDSFHPEILLRKGVAGGSTISVRALGFILIGHENHHCEIIKERYL